MKDGEQNKYPLYMPSGLKLKKEYMRGFGNQELKATIIAGIIFFMVDGILFLCGIKSIGILFFVPLIGTSTVGMLFIKNDNNLSPVDLMKDMIFFSKSQKEYPYIAKNEWENIQ